MLSARHYKRHMLFSRERAGIEGREAWESLQFRYCAQIAKNPSPGYVIEIMEARVGIEPTHKGFAVFHPSPKPLKIPANSVEFTTRIGRFFHGFSPYWGPFGDPL